MTTVECKPTVSRCTGHCCRRFYLGELQLEVLTKPRSETLGDLARILDMLIFLEWHEDDGGGRFTCRHFDADAGNCTIYDRRPKMCRDYPYGKECMFEGCTLKGENDE